MAFACLVATTALACQLVLGLDEPKQGTLPDAAPVPDPCGHARPPRRPDAGARGPEDNYWMVMGEISFPLVDEAGAPRGYDLDEACTCQADLHDGAPPCESLVGKACDPASGIDNTFAATLTPYATVLDLTAASNKLGNKGGRGVVIYLSSYNGEADDDDVGVTVVATEGLLSDLDCDGLPRPDASHLPSGYSTPYTPTHDGCDHWKIREEFIPTVGGVTAPLASTLSRGYVSGWTLVAPSRTTIVPLVGRALRANEGIITGHLVPVTVAGRRVFRLSNGVAAARSPMSNFVDLLAHMRVTSANGESEEICLGPLWTEAQRTLCESLDTMSVPTDDFQGQSCNAFSVTWGFTGQPIYLDDAGRTYPPDPPEVDCGVITTPAQLCRTAR